MVVFPNAKINLGLHIIDRRPDGYHNIESCFYPIPFTDVLEVIESNELSFSSSGITIPGNSKENLCLKAYELIKESYDIPPVAIHLHKHIPIGAGLGGGSADGAFMIKLLNQKFELDIRIEEQERLAGKLGSDCPFFIRNQTVYVEGTGNVFSEISFLLTGLYLVLVLPRIHVSTASAYAGILPGKPKHNLKNILETSGLDSIQNTVKNDFERPVFAQHPELEIIKNQLIENGSIYTSMSGSGSAIFGIFEQDPKLKFDNEFEIFKLN